jgi:predicted nucleic acid-binding Zn ribbon protein
MAKGKKNSQKNQSPTRYQRNLRIAIIVISILLALSMTLSLATNI